MQRRKFFQSAAASVAGVLTFGACKAKGDELVPIGERVVSVFRREADGRWLEIRPEDTRNGDRITTIGLDDARGELWRISSYTARSDWRPCPAGCNDCGQCHGEVLTEDVDHIL